MIILSKEALRKLLVFTNFYGKECQAKLPKEYVNKNYQVLISNYEHNSNQFFFILLVFYL